jgi:regulatory protein
MARDAAVSAGGGSDDESALRAVLARRFPGFAFAAADDRQRQRVVNFFRRRGFPLPLILTILNGREAD